MSIYDVSAAERRRRAQEMARFKAQARVQKNNPSTAERSPSPYTGEAKDEEKGFWATIGDIAGNVLRGAMKGLEGIYDLGATLVGEVGGWFDDDFQEYMRKEHIEYDWTEANTGWVDDLQKQSYLGEDSIVRDVANAVGNMLPSVALSAVPGGAPFATATFMSSAAGQGTEEAMKSGAGYESSMAYGIGSGLVEGATEKLGGFAFGGTSKLGKAVARTRLSKGLGKFAMNAASEGMEELITDVGIDPGLKYITGVDKNVGENYLNAVQNAPRTFGTGAVAGSVMQGGQTLGRNIVNKAKDRGGAKATRADNAVANIIEATGNYNGAANNDFKYDKVVKYNLETVSSELVKMSPEARKNYLDSIGVYKNAFDRETGKLKENSMPYAHREAITANLRTFSGNLSHKPLVGGVDRITEGAKTAKKTIERVIGSGAAVVVTNELGADDRAIYNPDDGVIYINNNADLTERDVTNVVALHEITHATEGTKAYTRLIETLENMMDDPNAPQAIKDIVGNVNKRKAGIRKDYAEQLGKMSDQYQKGYLVQSELHADLVGELLGNDYFIEKLAERDMGLLQKLYNSFKNRSKKKNSELGPEGIKYLKKLASKFGTAIEKRAGGVKISQIGDEDEEKGKSTSSEINVRFSKKQIPGTNEYFALIEKESIDKLNQYPGDSLAAKVRNYLKQFRGTVLPLGDTKKAFMRREAEGEYTNPAKSISPDDYSNKLNAASEIANLLSCAKFSHHEADNGRHPDAVRGWDYYSIKYVVPDEQGNLHAYKGEIQIKLIGRGDCFYDITKIEDITSGTAGQTLIKAAGSAQISSNNSISENEEKINSSDERKSKNRAYDPKNGKNDVLEIEEVAEQLSQEDAMQGRGLVEFLNAVEQMTDKSLISKRKHRIGRISVEHAEFAQTLLEEIGIDIDMSNFELWIDGTGAQHIEIRHGKEGKADSTMVEDELKAKIPWAVNNADSGEIMRNDNGEIEYSNRFFNADGSKAPQIKFYKKIGEDTLYVSECVPDCKFRRIYITSSYIKKGSKGQLLNMEEQSSPQPTPEASFDSNATNDIIHDNSEKNNSFDERKSKTSSNNSKTDSETDYFEEYLKEFNENFKANRENKRLKAENSRLRRFIANNVNQKVYSVSHSKEAISDILNGAYFGGYDAKIQGSKLKGIEKEVYDMLNFTEKSRGATALDIAEHIVLNTMLIEQVEMTEELELAQRIVTALKPYLHQMNIDSIKEDIKATFDDDKAPFVLWSVHKNSPFRGYTADEVAQELEAEGINISGERGRILNEADLFIKIHEMWTESRRIINEAVPDKATLLEMLNEDEVKKITQEIAKDLLRAYDKYGNKTKISKVEQKYKERLSTLSKKFKERSDIVNAKNQMLEVIKRIENSKSGLYANATQEHSRALKDWKGLLCRINSREMINRTSLVKILKRLNVLYEKETPVLEGFYSAQVKEILTYFSLMEESTKTSELELVELRFILDVLKHMDFFFNSFDKIWKDGRYVDLADVAEEQKARLDDAIKYKTNALINLAGEKLGKNMLDPQSVFAGLDAYDENGFFSTTFREIRYGLIECKANQIKALEELDDFREKNKKYFKKLLDSKNTVKVSFTIIRDEDGLPQAKDIEIPVYAAIDLYMTSRTGKDALETLQETGFFLKRDNSKKSERMGTVTKEQLDILYNSFSEQDKELIEILRKQYNGFLQQLKIETDFKRFGFSNVIDGEYYPLRRYVAESSEEPDNFFNEVDRVLNSPFNNSRVKGTKNALLIGNALTKFMRHVEGVTKYASLAIPIENANRIKNADVGGNLRMPKSILTTLKENPQFNWANSYLDNFIADIQGISIRMDDGQKLIGKLRGAFATYQLGFNPKVWATQLSSYLAAFGELKLSSLVKAITIKDSEVDKYCELAKIRHYEKGVTKASTVSEKVGKFGNITTAVIEKVDRRVIKMLFAACQAEAKSRYKLEIGTEANKIKAGEILTDVILNSQQNQLFSEYSAMMRSKSDIVKSFTMFGADSMKLLSRFFENLGRVITLNKKMKAFGKGSDAYNSLKAQRNKAALKLAKYSAAIACVAAFMAAIAKLFKHIYNKDDEEETVGEWLGIGTVDNILGMAPVFRDLYSLYRDGYEVDTFATSMINDVGTSFKTLIDNTVSSIQGKDVGQTEWLATTKKLVYAIGQLTGVPTRNVYNFTVGMTRRFNEGAGKSIDAWFKSPSESDAKESLREGVEDGDESLTEYGLGQVYKKYELELTDKVLKGEMDRLLKLDVAKDEDDSTNYSPLGFKTPENLEIDGEDVELSAEDRKVFKNGLKSAEKSSAAMVKTYMYKKLDDKYKAYAIRKVYEYYDLLARYEVAGTDEQCSPLRYFGAEVGIDMLAVLMAYKQELNGALDEEKAKRTKSTKELVIEYLNKFNLTPVQKSLALRALGYSDKERDELVKSFISRRYNLTKEQKAEFLEMAKVG